VGVAMTQRRHARSETARQAKERREHCGLWAKATRARREAGAVGGAGMECGGGWQRGRRSLAMWTGAAAKERIRQAPRGVVSNETQQTFTTEQPSPCSSRAAAWPPRAMAKLLTHLLKLLGTDRPIKPRAYGAPC
jgi:hypothetical protein